MNYILILFTLLICFLLNEAAHATPQQKVLQALAQTENGKITQENVDKYAKDKNLQYLAPAALLTGKLKLKNGGSAVILEKNKITVMKTWNFN